MHNPIIATIQKVPRGYVSTYGAIAKAAGYPRGARLVARTLRSAVGLPWHRILGAGGEIKLRGHSALDQRLRLEMEGVTFRGRRVNMRLHEFKFSGARKKGTTQRAGRKAAEGAAQGSTTKTFETLTAKGAKRGAKIAKEAVRRRLP